MNYCNVWLFLELMIDFGLPYIFCLTSVKHYVWKYLRIKISSSYLLCQTCIDNWTLGKYRNKLASIKVFEQHNFGHVEKKEQKKSFFIIIESRVYVGNHRFAYT